MYLWFIIYSQIKRYNVKKNNYNCTKFTINNYNETNQIMDQAYYVVLSCSPGVSN